MLPIAFQSSVVSRGDEKISLALFNDGPEPACVVVLECRQEVAAGLARDISSALKEAAAK